MVKERKHPNCWKCGETGLITRDGITWDCPDYLVTEDRKRRIKEAEDV